MSANGSLYVEAIGSQDLGQAIRGRARLSGAAGDRDQFYGRLHQALPVHGLRESLEVHCCRCPSGRTAGVKPAAR